MKQCLTAEAARILNVTPAAIRAMERRGALPAERTETGVRIFNRRDVERVAEERTAQRQQAGSTSGRAA